MHVFSLGRFCASPKPSPRGEGAELCSPDEVERSRLPPAVPVSRRVPVPHPKPSPRGEGAELCSPDAVEASRPLRRRRSRAASCVISCFQSSMLLHNLSSTFSLEKKASAPCTAPASCSARSPQRTQQPQPRTTPLPGQSTRTTPLPGQPPRTTSLPGQPSRTTPLPGQPSRTTSLPGQPSRTTPLPGQPSRTTPLPGQPAQRRPHSPLRQVFHRLSTEFSTFPPVSHSGFLSPWLS